MQNPNINKTDQATDDFLHSKLFKGIVIFISCMVGIPAIFISCLLFLLFLSILIPGLGVFALIVGAVFAWIAEMLSISYPAT
jgi:hypothetical protein